MSSIYLNFCANSCSCLMQVQVRRSVLGTEFNGENDGSTHSTNNFRPPIIRKGKLVFVDLAGSERIHKSGALGCKKLAYPIKCSFFLKISLCISKVSCTAA